MKWILILFSFPLFLFSNDQTILEKLSKDYAWAYQDILVNGKKIHHGWQCAERYAVIKPILDQYERPIKILDIGADNGYFSIRASTEHDATCVMADTTLRLKRICEYNNEVPGLIYLKKRLSSEDLKYLAEHEHFDVVLVLNVLHHISGNDNYKDFLDAALALGDNVIIETPPLVDQIHLNSQQVADVFHELESRPNKTVIGSFPRLTEGETYPTVDYDRMDSVYWFCKKPKEAFPDLYLKPIQTGIKLSVFDKLRGRYPTKKQIKEQKKSLPLLKRFSSEKIIVKGAELE